MLSACPPGQQLPPTGDDELTGVVRSLAGATASRAPGPREERLVAAAVGGGERPALTAPHGSAVDGRERPAAGAPRPAHEDAATGFTHCLVSAVLEDADLGPALARLRADNPGALAAALGGRLVMYRAAPPACDALRAVYAVAPVRDGDTAQAYRTALQTLAIARSYRLDNLEAGEVLPLLSVLSQGDRERETFLSQCLGPLRDERRHAHLLATLAAYLRHGMCTAAAARSLFVHRHTLEYRLRRVRHLTGLDLGHPLHRLRAELALLMTGD